MREKNFELYLEALTHLQKQKESFVSITLVDSKGSSPQDIGARALVTTKGLQFGTIGGGKLENFAIQRAQKIIRDKIATRELIRINLQKDLGMSCGGEVSLFIESHLPENKWNIVVFGAGHVSQELIPLLLKLDCKVTCVDSRQDWLEKLHPHSRLQKVSDSHPENWVSQIPKDSFIVVMTMGHSTDVPILERVYKSGGFPYVGAIGSELKAKKLKRELVELGITESALDSLFCPIGEEFGSNSPVEIAFSVVAQLLKYRDRSL